MQSQMLITTPHIGRPIIPAIPLARYARPIRKIAIQPIKCRPLVARNSRHCYMVRAQEFPMFLPRPHWPVRLAKNGLQASGNLVPSSTSTAVLRLQV